MYIRNVQKRFLSLAVNEAHAENQERFDEAVPMGEHDDSDDFNHQHLDDLDDDFDGDFDGDFGANGSEDFDAYNYSIGEESTASFDHNND